MQLVVMDPDQIQDLVVLLLSREMLVHYCNMHNRDMLVAIYISCV